MRGSSLGTPTSAGKLRSQKLDECARARPPVGAQPPETEKEHQEVENFRVLQRGKLRVLRRMFLFLFDEFRERGVKPRGHGNLRRFFVVNPGQECAAGFRHGLHGGEHVRVGEGTLIRGIDEHGVSKSRQHGLPRVNQIGGKRYVRERDVTFGERLRMVLLPAVRRHQIGAIARAVDGSLRARSRNRWRRFSRPWRDNIARRAAYCRSDRSFCRPLVVAPQKVRGALLGFLKSDTVRKATLRRDFNKFEPVSPWIFGVEPPRAGKVVIVDDLHTPGRQRLRAIRPDGTPRRPDALSWLAEKSVPLRCAAAASRTRTSSLRARVRSEASRSPSSPGPSHRNPWPRIRILRAPRSECDRCAPRVDSYRCRIA